MIYLDYTANTPADPAVLEAFLNTEQNYIGNPNSNHPAGQAAREKHPVLLADQSQPSDHPGGTGPIHAGL